MNSAKIFPLLVGINLLILILQIDVLSISYHEAEMLYGSPSLLHIYVSSFLNLFGWNDYALRISMIVLHFLSVLLLYRISEHYLPRTDDRNWVLLIYMLLPGVTSAALVADIAGLKILILFIFFYLFIYYRRFAYLFLPFFILLDWTVIFFYFLIGLYGILNRQKWVAGIGSVLFIASLFVYNVQIGGTPKGHFIEILALYAAVFSPLVFLYIFYVLYRRLMSDDKELLWFLAFGMFIITMLLSFRQKVNIQEFAPYIMVAIPLIAQTFFHTYRIRLRIFRGRYQLLFYIAFSILIINSISVFFNHWLYRYMDEPDKHFAYPMHVAKELAHYLDDKKITCLQSDEEMQLRLRFYGIGECSANQLTQDETKGADKVTISYKNRPAYEAYVTKISN